MPLLVDRRVLASYYTCSGSFEGYFLRFHCFWHLTPILMTNWSMIMKLQINYVLEQKIGIYLTVSSTLKKTSKNYTFLFWDVSDYS